MVKRIRRGLPSDRPLASNIRDISILQDYPEIEDVWHESYSGVRSPVEEAVFAVLVLVGREPWY